MLHPLVERELRVALHKRQRTKSRVQIALLASGFAIFFIFIFALTRSGSAVSELQTMLFFFGLYLSVIPPLQNSAGLFAEERRNQTLELLYLTGMQSFELFTGKLLGGIIVVMDDLLGLLPFLALPFLVGGVSLESFLATITCFPTILFFTVAVSVFASVLSSDESTALMLTLSIAAVICLVSTLPFALGLFITGKPPFSTSWLYSSPAYALYLVQRGAYGNSLTGFWPTIRATLLLSSMIVVAAGVLLDHNWQRQSAKRNAIPFFDGILVRCFAKIRRWCLAKRCSNPLELRVRHDRVPILSGWALVTGIVALWLLGWWAWPNFWLSTATFLFTGLTLVGGFHFCLMVAGARLMARDRRDNALELVLTTPLTPRQFVTAQLQGILAEFEPLRRAVFGLCLLMMIGGFLARTWTTGAVVSYSLIWVAYFAWCLSKGTRSLASVMWIAFNCGRSGRALAGGTGGWIWVWILYNLGSARSTLGHAAAQFPTGSTAEVVIVSFVFIIGAILVAANQGGQIALLEQLILHLRSIAQQPVPDPRDPRFKNWDIKQPFPTPRN